jgi:LPXTG-motif cell wall-anchored protein
MTVRPNRRAPSVALALAAAALLLGGNPASAHRNGCHRWHSCPSDSGSYVCGDLGYDTYCPEAEPEPEPAPARTTPARTTPRAKAATPRPSPSPSFSAPSAQPSPSASAAPSLAASPQKPASSPLATLFGLSLATAGIYVYRRRREKKKAASS